MPLSPTAHKSFAAALAIPLRIPTSGTGVVILQVLPFQCSTSECPTKSGSSNVVSCPPTAQLSPSASATTPRNTFDPAPLGLMLVHHSDPAAHVMVGVGVM